ncbi:exodeoxyribonuclease V subunit gamma [Candidatus Steffania adelgidicola]|uniref:exodeoxyribonuclease V subunit gamma n=1 Tax=Candidatus Steffania adelgidicola TaxID=1076626 RepID=UPI001D028327|nr:exodeoxyribonuclease V subunit gamma [Candidatus Steffania adelgidicola]UDG79835.1 RecBCD enzyme subunit RecC [Candidatus Steffania adelgidicola]
MFTVYHSNQLEQLLTLNARIILEQPLHDPFQPEIILVQSTDMARWIQMELAKHLGIAINIECLRPADFISKMFTRVLPELPQKSIFSKSLITWFLLRLCQMPDCETVSVYLRHDHDKHKTFKFVTQIANLFEKYLLYRPDWLERWERGELIQGIGEAQRWQAPLWCALVAETKRIGKRIWDNPNLYQRFIQTLTQSKICLAGLPNRVFIYDISAISPSQFDTLIALGHHIDIHLLFRNPCRYYWGDIRDPAVPAQLPQHRQSYFQEQPEDRLFRSQSKACAFINKKMEQKIDNPLLVSWGKKGLDTLYLLTQTDSIAQVDAFIEPTGNSLLSILKRDILRLEDHTLINMSANRVSGNKRQRLLQANDRSLSIHVCHSPQRELEVLHDSLLAMIEEDSTIEPHNVIVMVADIDRYAAAIQSVFSKAGREQYLPFTISDSRVRSIHPVVLTVLNLLELPQSRFSAEQVLALLEVPALSARFKINETELHILRKWVAESGIRWGLDDDTFRKLMLPATGQNTWQFGLTRMLLGYAMESKSGDWQGIVPYDESSGLIANLVGQLGELLKQLRQWQDWLAQPRSLDSWGPCARKMIEDFFLPDPEAESALALMENYWQQILRSGIQTGYNQPVPVRLLREQLAQKLDQNRVNHRFLSGGINFCTLLPMRLIPYRIICLLGMNDGVYPRTPMVEGFDLMAQQPRHGDQSDRYGERYLFLELLLCAQEKLYISFIGNTLQDNTSRYPSILISELSDYITHSFYLLDDMHLNVENNTEQIRAHLWQWHSRMPFMPENFLPDSKFQSFANEWLPAARNEGKPESPFITPLKPLDFNTISLDELMRFYRHPIRAWFVQRLGISFQQTSIELLGEEPFILDNLTRYQLNNRLLNVMINEESTEKLFRQVRGAGLLPYGAFGELYWLKESKKLAPLAQQVRAWRLLDTQDLDIHIKLDNILLSGLLPKVQENGLLRWRPGTLSARDGILLWLEHLVYCAMGGKGESRIVGMRGAWHFAPLPSCQAKDFLVFLINGYSQGMTSPLLLLPRSGGAWLTHCYNKVTQSVNKEEIRQLEAHDKLIQAWQGNKYYPGEIEDPYLNRVLHPLDKKQIKAIILAAKHYFLPFFKCNLF